MSLSLSLETRSPLNFCWGSPVGEKNYSPLALDKRCNDCARVLNEKIPHDKCCEPIRDYCFNRADLLEISHLIKVWTPIYEAYLAQSDFRAEELGEKLISCFKKNIECLKIQKVCEDHFPKQGAWKFEIKIEENWNFDHSDKNVKNLELTIYSMEMQQKTIKQAREKGAKLFPKIVVHHEDAEYWRISEEKQLEDSFITASKNYMEAVANERPNDEIFRVGNVLKSELIKNIGFFKTRISELQRKSTALKEKSGELEACKLQIKDKQKKLNADQNVLRNLGRQLLSFQRKFG